MLAEYADFLKRNHLAELALAHMRRCGPLEAPIIRHLATWPLPERRHMVERWVEAMLVDLAGEPPAAPTAMRWDRVLAPSDRVLVHSVCREVLVSFIPRFTRDMAVAMAIVQALEAHQRSIHQAALAVLERRSAEAERLKDEFLGIISHELRTPLNAIMGFGSILEDELAGPMSEAQHAYMAKIFEGAEGLLALIDDVLDMGLIQAGRFVIRPQPMQLEQAIRSAVGAIVPLAAQQGHAIALDVPRSLPAIAADLGRIRQVVSYLITNAIKFTPEGGTIEVRARPAGAALRCEIVDNGPGVPPGEVARLFDRFTQLDMGPTRRVGGTGLGLSICRGIVEAHGGTIGVESPATGGATFYFTLPLAPVAARTGS